MDDREAHEFYKDPEHLRIAGPGRKRNGQRLTSMTAVRFSPETIEAVKDVAHNEGITVSTWIRRLVSRTVAAPTEPEMMPVTVEGFSEPLQVRAGLLRELASALFPALVKHGSVSLTLGQQQVMSMGPASMTTAMPVSASVPRPQGLIPGSGRQGEPKALRSSLSLSCTFRCEHISIGNVAGASCGQCGPLARVL